MKINNLQIKKIRTRILIVNNNKNNKNQKKINHKAAYII